jgi:hypothetical protein
LGDKVKDTVTGFEGIIVAKTDWLYGCTRCTVQPGFLDKDGKTIEAQGFDELQLELIESGVVKSKMYEAPKQAKAVIGGPAPEPSRRKDPTR